MRYEKPALNLDQELEQLKSRGLQASDKDRVLRYLARIGYYRLSPYMTPFQEPGSEHIFRSGTDFDSVLGLYIFDRRLRLLLMDALERFEVALRATLSNHMALKNSDAFWYLDSSAFGSRFDSWPSYPGLDTSQGRREGPSAKRPSTLAGQAAQKPSEGNRRRQKAVVPAALHLHVRRPCTAAVVDDDRNARFR